MATAVSSQFGDGISTLNCVLLLVTVHNVLLLCMTTQCVVVKHDDYTVCCFV